MMLGMMRLAARLGVRSKMVRIILAATRGATPLHWQGGDARRRRGALGPAHVRRGRDGFCNAQGFTAARACTVEWLSGNRKGGRPGGSRGRVAVAIGALK
eukprot:2928965-Prymnesium_polylepis.1